MFKFPPFLTEQWAAAYFQILSSALVFAIGIPFLGLQLVMQEDVRHVVTYRQWKLLLWLVLVLLLFLSSVSFIWFLHPGQPIESNKKTAGRSDVSQQSDITGQTGNANAPTVSADSPAGNADAPGNAASPTPAQNADDGGGEAANQYEKAMLAGIIITVFPVVAVVFGYWLPTNYTRKKVIREFKSDLIRGFNKHRVLKRETLLKLVYLGEHGNPGIEKNLVLNAFREVAAHVQKDADGYKYKGLELAEMVKSLRTILEEGDKKGNDENYKRSAELLKKIWTNVSGDISNHDASQAVRTLKQLGMTAVREKPEEVALIYVMTAADCDDSVVYELGAAALEVKCYRPATIALRKLTTLALNEHPSKLEATETVSNMLGLLARYDSLGPSARKVSAGLINKYEHLFYPSLGECIKTAHSYHFGAGNFDTADKLLEMSGALAKQRAEQI